MRARLHEDQNRNGEDGDRNAGRARERLELAVALQQGRDGIGDQPEDREERQPAKDPDRLRLELRGNVQERHQRRCQRERRHREHEAEQQVEHVRAEQEASRVRPLRASGVDREKARERGGNATVQRGQGAQGDQRKRPDAEPIEPEATDEHGVSAKTTTIGATCARPLNPMSVANRDRGAGDLPSLAGAVMQGL